MHLSTNRIEIIQGDITRVKTDAIVNAANSSLMGGGGVDGAIHRAGGPAILEACKAIVARQGECPAGEAVITSGGNLPAKYVIHTVGPVWHGGSRNEEQKLADCYRNSLTLVVENDCRTVAFPNISTGVYRFPKKLAAQIAVQTVKQFLNTHPSIEKILFVCFEAENASLIEKELKKV
jgi:O-acetyl-ADP-ribose deacetylase